MKPKSDRRERARNRLLRRVDWRFLLPDPHPQRAVCFSGGLLARGVQLVAASVVEPDDPSQGACDLAVAVNPARATLSRAWDSLASGGICYSEWYPRSGVTLRGIRSRLAAAGFEGVACYWAWPPPKRASPLFWLPLANPRALAHFLTNRPPSRSAPDSLRRALLGRLWSLAMRAGVVSPVCVVAYKPPPEGEGSKVEPLSRILAGVAPAQADWLLLTGGGRSINKVVALLFPPGARDPGCVVKLARVPEAADALAQESRVLQALQTLVTSGVQGVPRPLFFQGEGATPALGETYLGGQPLFTLLNQGNYRTFAERAADWLLQLVPDTRPIPCGEWSERLIEPVIRDFQSNFGPVLLSGSVDRARKCLDELGPLPTACEQRDFSPWNVLVTTRGELAVLDWESAEPHGLPALDLIYFVTYLAFFHDGAMESRRFRQSYRAMLDPHTVTGRVTEECMARYCAGVGLDPRKLHALRLLAWMLHSRSEFSRLAADAGGAPSAGTLRGSLFLSLWQEELAHGEGA